MQSRNIGRDLLFMPLSEGSIWAPGYYHFQRKGSAMAASISFFFFCLRKSETLREAHNGGSAICARGIMHTAKLSLGLRQLLISF